MRIGVSSAQGGKLANPAAVHAAALAMEQVGYSSIWVRQPEPEAAEGSLDAIAVLAATAMVTTRVRLGATIHVPHAIDAAGLARSLATLDVLSDGRLTVGLQVDCCGAGGLIEDIDKAWAGAPLTPVQRPRPPLLVATASRRGLAAVIHRADGWQALGVGADEVAPAWREARERAAERGRDPEALLLVVRAEITLTDRPLGAGRAAYTGDLSQVTADLAAAAEAGAAEVVLGFATDVGFDEALDGYARIAEALNG
jgi:alkanesulfonate monooxygenase SsuD/methylene tetrahydromethanopterin reductase-like flavin-dependent oxidoreductase (luciferase family)